MSEILKEYFPKSNFAVLSGPNFSFEVLKDYPLLQLFRQKTQNLLQMYLKL